MHEIQAVVNIAASGTMDCVQHTVTWLIGRIQQADDQSLVERTISVASAGLDSTLIMSEALMDRVFPPTEEEEEGTQSNVDLTDVKWLDVTFRT